MTVATQQRRVQYASAGTAFPVPFPFPAVTDLVVTRTSSGGVDSLLVLNSDYSVSGAGNPAGGTVTLISSALLPGEKLTIKRQVARTQLTDYVPNDSFPAEAHEAALDKLTMIAQEDGDELSRALQVPDTDAARGQMLLPSVTDRAGRLLGFDGAGRPAAGPLSAQVQQLVDTAFTPGVSGVSAGVSHSRAGGVTRTVESVLRDRFDLRDFGVRNRFVTANEYTAEIQAALNQAKSEGITTVFSEESYRVAGTVTQPASIAIVSAGGVSRWYESSPAGESAGPGFYKPSDGLNGPLLIRGVGAHLIGQSLDHQKVSGGTEALGGIMQFGPLDDDETFVNTITMNVHIRGHELDEITGLRRGTVDFSTTYGLAGTDCTAILFPASTALNQRYWHQFLNIYLENHRTGFKMNRQAHGVNVLGLRYRGVYRPVWLKGGPDECIENYFQGIWAQNYYLPTTTLDGAGVKALSPAARDIALADAAMITMEDNCGLHTFVGPTESGARLWYLSPASANRYNDASGLINNEPFVAAMPPAWRLPGNEFDAGRRSWGGKREKFLPLDSGASNASQGHGNRIDLDHVQTTGLPLLNGSAGPPTTGAASRIMAKWTLPETVSKAAAPHFRLQYRCVVHAPGGAAGSHSTEIELEYRVADNDGAVGGLSVISVRQFPSSGNYVVGCHFISGETGGSRPFAIALTLGSLGPVAPTQVSQSLIGKLESTNATARPMAEFGDVDFTPTALTGNDVLDAVSLLATGVTAI